MAGPFDISSYESTASKGAVDPEILRQANRATRVAKYGESAVAAMEQAGSRFAGGATSSPASVSAGAEATASAAAAQEAAPLSRFARVKSLLNPNITARGIGAVGKANLAIAPIVGAAKSAFDTRAEVADLGDSVGIDASTAGGRAGANVVNFLNNTGNAATFGLAGRLGRVLSGGSFFDPDAPAKTGGAAPGNAAGSDAGNLYPASATPAPAQIGAVSSRVRPVTGATNLRAANAFIDGTEVPEVGTGFLRNNDTGAIQEFRSPGAVAAPAGPARTPGGRIAIDASGYRDRKDAAAKTAALSATGAYLRGEAAYMKAEEGGSSNKTDIIPSLDPNKPATVIQVKGGRATNIPVIKQIPVGYDQTSMVAEAKAALQREGSGKRAAINARLAEYGLPPLQ